MKKQILFAIILIALHQSIFAQKKSTDDFDAFWKTFKTALTKDDKATVINLTRFPIYYNDADIKNEKEFTKIYTKYFDKKTKHCLLTKKPVKDGTDYYSILCGETGYDFQKTEEGWKFSGTHAND